MTARSDHEIEYFPDFPIGEVGNFSKDVKLAGHRPGLPGKEIFVHIVPLDPAYKAGFAGHGPVNKNRILRLWKLTCPRK